MESYDYVIVGSGVAATLVAQTLLKADANTSILMLEAGERIASRDRRSWWDVALNNRRPYVWTYDVEDENPDPESFSIGGTKFGFTGSRVRAFGGSTMHWGGWSLRFKEEDFECFSRTGRGADWPIGYDDLEPWYAEAERVLSVCGKTGEGGPWRSGDFPVIPFPWSAHEYELAEAFEAKGLVPGHMPLARYHRCMTTGTCKYCPIGSRFTAQEMLEALEADPTYVNFEIKTSSPALELIANTSDVEAIRYWDDASGAATVAAAEKVIVCAGAYESPKLLMRSRSTHWPDGVGNKHDQVGRYLVTHTMLVVRGSKPANPDRLLQEYDFPTLMSRSWDTPDRQREGKVLLFNNASRPNTDIARAMVSGSTKADIDNSLTSERRAGLSAFIEEFGVYENRLTLGAGTGHFGLPKTEVDFTIAPDLPATADKVLSEMNGILEAAGYQTDDGSRYDPRGDHTSGTCRMGTDAGNSVTDLNLQVHDVANLYVCSNAVFPNAAAVNPTLTLAALSLRLGTHLVTLTEGAN